jgi:hypothetical protein
VSLLILFDTGPPLAVFLDAKAEYIEGEATQPTVLVTAYFYNPVDETYKPQLVLSGTATLIRSGIHNVQTIEFDRRFGNSDGAFHFQFSHPAVSNNLSVRIVADLRDIDRSTAHLDRTIQVLQEEERPIPLESQPDTGDSANDELRSKKRKEEFL